MSTTQSTANVLVVNVGSATLKSACYRCAGEEPPRRLGRSRSEVVGAPVGDAVCRALARAESELAPESITAVGHRIVHGGPRFVEPAVVDDSVVTELEALIPLAPLHQAPGLAAIGAVRAARPELPQVAVFDTAFHATMPAVARRFALPEIWFERGLRRYGFHGVSYEYVASMLAEQGRDGVPHRVVVAHLGGGASLCALLDGRSVATTMSLSPTDGLPMATRCGALDPEAVLYLVRACGHDVAAVERLLNAESGLLGVSGSSADMRELLERADASARLAVDLFVNRAVLGIGSMVAALGGIDALVFTGGIGSHAPVIRERICAALEWLQVSFDRPRNTAGEMRFEAPGSRVALWTIVTDEERVIAGYTARAVRAALGR